MLGSRKNSHFKVPVATGFDRPAFASPIPVRTEAGKLIGVGVSGELAAIRSKLNILDKYFLNREVRREMGRVLHDAYMQIAEAKRQELVLRITLDLDERKKQLFMAKLESSRVIDKEIAEGSALFTKEMVDGALAVAIYAATEKKAKLAELDELLKEGRIDEESHAELREGTVEAMRYLADTVKDCVARILSTHLSKIEQTLALFKERGLDTSHF